MLQNTAALESQKNAWWRRPAASKKKWHPARATLALAGHRPRSGICPEAPPSSGEKNSDRRRVPPALIIVDAK